MKLATFTHAGKTRIGKIIDDRIIDLSAAAPDLPTDMVDFLVAGKEAMAAAARVVEGPSLSLNEVKLEAPVLRPRKFLAVGFNFHDHVEEVLKVKPDMQLPKVPVFFNKQVTSINAPYGSIDLPSVSKELDYEVELAVVIGKRCRHVSAENALEVIAGYCVCNDVSVRDWQLASPTTTMGKSFDTHGPIGPWITTPDETGPVESLWMRTWVNGEVRQDGSMSTMVHSIGRQIEYLSGAFTLEPGDIIATGTVAGVGVLMNPQTFLKEGDVVRVEVEKLGHLEHTVVRERV
ncbi:fumarylacetoacetate hydrolase family protein [Hydrocarboniphaga sp.]|uniref:fumarylacetoacetate hydrolase family protein n=1 Tax=Hydrocarboniphaga sp. TaxID=2033016 RepID=UPI003D0F6D9E